MTPPDGKRGDGLPERPGPVAGHERPVYGPPRRDLRMGQRYSRWAIWGCASLTLVALLLGGGFLLVAMQQPGFGKWLHFAKNVATCREHLIQVSGALERYHMDKGKLPARLEDLYPTYLAKRENLYCPSDPEAPHDQNVSADPKGAGEKATEVEGSVGTSYVLRPWQEWGRGSGVVVYCPHHPAWGQNPATAREKRRHQINVVRQDGIVETVTEPLTQLRREDQAKTTVKASEPGPAGVPSPAR